VVALALPIDDYAQTGLSHTMLLNSNNATELISVP